MSNFEEVTLEDLRDTIYGAIANFVNPANRKRKGELVNYVIPSIPLTRDDTFFLDGEMPASGPERADAFQKKQQSAYFFSQLLDFSPSTTAQDVLLTEPQANDGPVFTNFDEFRSTGMTVSQAYETLLRDCKVYDRPRTPEEQEKIDKLHAKLYAPDVEDEVLDIDSDVATNDEEDDLLGDLGDDFGDIDLNGLDDIEDDFLEGGEPPVPTKLMENFLFCKNKFETAEMAMVQKLIEIEENPKYARLKAKIIAHEKKKLRHLMKIWRTAGKRDYVMKIQNVLAAMEQGGMVAYRDALQERMENLAFDVNVIADATDKVYYTSLSPANLMKAEGWTAVSLENKSDSNSFSSKSTSFSGSIGVDLPGGYGFGGNHSQSKSSEKAAESGESLSISFEITQGLINRRWFDPAVFQCGKITMTDPATGESLATLGDDDFYFSNGEMPPNGILPAYITSVILVRNVKITSASMKKIDSEITKSSTSGGSVNVGGFKVFGKRIGVKASAEHKKDEVDKFYKFDESTGTLTMLGTHIVAFRGVYLPKFPNPNFDKYPDASDWV